MSSTTTPTKTSFWQTLSGQCSNVDNFEGIKRSALSVKLLSAKFHMGWEVSVGWFWQQQIPAIFPRTYWLRYHAQLFSTIASVPDHARGFGKLEHLGLRKNPGVVHQYRSYREGCERKHMQDEISSIVPNDIDKHVTHHYADNNGVRIHYASIGKGPLIVMIHGFPDFWYTWRNQMVALAPLFQVVALDLRGYNLSDKPLGGEHYSIHHLVEDVQAVIRHLRRDKAIIIGHDWGGAIAWIFAIGLPALTERLIILNCPHPSCIIRELAHNPQQQEQSAYARDFQKEDAHKRLTPESLSAWVKDSAARERYLEAFRRSDFEAMLHYYKQNYPRPPYQEVTLPVKVQAPVLQIHGMQDPFLLPGGLNGTWEWLENDWILLTIRQAGHFVQHDAAGLVAGTMVNWLTR